MKLPLKIVSGVVTVGLLVGALMIGGGAPPDPARLARLATEAVRNAREATDNIRDARSDTEALATISDNVVRQLGASQRLLEIQLGIERSSRSSADASGSLGRNILKLRSTLRALRDRLAELSVLSEGAGAQARSAADSAGDLREQLDTLKRHYDELIEESRELNRKAKGYAELKDGPS